MRDLNKVTLIGNLGRDPEVTYTSTGKVKVTASLACNRQVKQPDGSYRSQAEWFRLVFWGNQAETVNSYLHKGSRVYIEGRQETREWTNQQTGQTQKTTEVVVNEMLMLDTRAGEAGSEASSSSEGIVLPFGESAGNAGEEGNQEEEEEELDLGAA